MRVYSLSWTKLSLSLDSVGTSRSYVAIHDKFKCCGALRFEDWLFSEWARNENVIADGSLVPDSCCKTVTPLCGKRDHPSNIQYMGCIYKFLETTKDHLIILVAVDLGLSVLEVFGIILGSCLYIILRHDFDDCELLHHDDNNNGRSWCRYAPERVGQED